jgi:uncharacterized protein YegP (UPF0339 family)
MGDPVHQDQQLVTWGKALVTAIPSEILAAYTAVLGVVTALAADKDPGRYLPFRFAWYAAWILITPIVATWLYRHKALQNTKTINPPRQLVGAEASKAGPKMEGQPATLRGFYIAPDISAPTIAAAAWFTAMPGSPWQAFSGSTTFAITSAVAATVGALLLGLTTRTLTTGLGRAKVPADGSAKSGGTTTPRTGSFEIYQDKAGEFGFRLKAGNGEIVAAGESYPTEAGAKKGCDAVKRAAAAAVIRKSA